jgi:hypothetical protein
MISLELRAVGPGNSLRRITGGLVRQFRPKNLIKHCTNTVKILVADLNEYGA